MFGKIFKSKTEVSTTTVVGNNNQVAGSNSHHNVFSANNILTPLRSVTLRQEGTTSAVSLSKISSVSLVKKAESSAISLQKDSLLGLRFAVTALVDASGSMGGFYRQGLVQTLTERALGFALTVDGDGMIPVGSFGSTFEWKAEVTQDNYVGVVDREKFYSGGSTNLAAGLDAVEKLAKTTNEPIYLLVITDGAPDNRAAVKKSIIRLSRYPVFIKFLVVGNDASAWNFVENDLNNMDKSLRLVDNVNAKRIVDPTRLTDQQFADIMVEELKDWISASKAAGLLV